MRRVRRLAHATLATAATLGLAGAASAGDFDARGVFSFDPNAVVTQDFTKFSEAPDAGDGSGTVKDDATALAGGKVLHVSLKTEGYPIPLTLPAAQGSYRLSFWLRGDCIGGAAVDYDDTTTGTISTAFPSGRVTSDGWVEMLTQPFQVDGTKSGVDARMYLSAYDATKPVSVDIDAVEVVPDGNFAAPKTCSGLDPAGVCSAGQMCLSGLCQDARGWFPPLPDDTERPKFVAYWKQKLHDTFGPLALRKTSLPDAEATLDAMTDATSNVAFWSRFTEAIRRLKDAHTYFRLAVTSEIKPRRPLNVCFFQGEGDVSQTAAPSTPGLPDVLVSHTGPSDTWGLSQGDRLVAIDGEHPLVWAKQLIGPSLTYWEADDPNQLANIFTLLRELIEQNAVTITVVHCDAASGSCDSTPETINVADLPVVAAADVPKLVGCDNRPFFSVDGAPPDHDFGDAVITPAKIIQGPVLDATSDEKIYGVIWNTLYGDGQSTPVDAALKSAVSQFDVSRGVLLDHREGHGGTSQTADILVSFARTPFTPFISWVRNRANDEGPADAAAGAALFNHYHGQNDVYGSSSAHTDVPVALLTTWDVSASDMLPQMLKGGPKVRLFGPGPSMGAFGTFMQYSIWGVMHWSLGIEDSITEDGTTLCTHGVVPDEVVAPKQSDLLAGKDTVHDAAMAWLRTELKP